MPHIGPWELIIILMIILIIFGAGKLPEIGNAIGRSIREFKKAQRDDETTVKSSKAADEEEKTPAKVPKNESKG